MCHLRLVLLQKLLAQKMHGQDAVDRLETGQSVQRGSKFFKDVDVGLEVDLRQVRSVFAE